MKPLIATGALNQRFVSIELSAKAFAIAFDNSVLRFASFLQSALFAIEYFASTNLEVGIRLFIKANTLAMVKTGTLEAHQ